MSLLTVALFVLGIVLLIGGAELLVRGASRLAVAAGLSPLIIGLTVVSFGTSAPELAVSTQSAFSGQADLALGNVIGSNIFNVLLILGISALIIPLTVQRQLVRLDVPLMIGVSFLMALMGWDGVIGRIDGILLAGGLAAYIGFQIWYGRRDSAAVEVPDDLPERPQGAMGWIGSLALVIGGLALLILGSRWLVDGAVAIARFFGLSELIIGLTIVAGGTSLPEVAASIIAALRGQRDIAVGNVVGSNLFNIMGILGITAAIAPAGVAVDSAALAFDIPVMIAVAVACLPIFFTGYMIARWEGALFLGYYLAYTAYIVLNATGHDVLPLFSTTMSMFVLPFTFVILLIAVVRSLIVGQRPATVES